MLWAVGTAYRVDMTYQLGAAIHSDLPLSRTSACRCRAGSIHLKKAKKRLGRVGKNSADHHYVTLPE
jgi:hypothetical protein